MRREVTCYVRPCRELSGPTGNSVSINEQKRRSKTDRKVKVFMN